MTCGHGQSQTIGQLGQAYAHQSGRVGQQPLPLITRILRLGDGALSGWRWD